MIRLDIFTLVPTLHTYCVSLCAPRKAFGESIALFGVPVHDAMRQRSSCDHTRRLERSVRARRNRHEV